jgi:voltage-gated potassium channel
MKRAPELKLSHPRRPPRFDRNWRRSLLFTLALIALVNAAVGADRIFSLVSLAICAVAFGFFYLTFPGGMLFGITLGNFLAVYECAYIAFHEANFHEAAYPASIAGLTLPVLGFLCGCFLRRPEIAHALQARRARERARLPRLSRWLPAVLIVAAISFALQRAALSPGEQDIALVAAMSVITGFVVYAVRDLVLLMMDVALIFEGVSARLSRLVPPVMAFLTFYSLLVIVFACLYRIAEFVTGRPQFAVFGKLEQIRFVDVLYFSVATISTVGYGDISPATPLVRGLAGLEVISGLLVLLFGFSEIMRTADPRDRR